MIEVDVRRPDSSGESHAFDQRGEVTAMFSEIKNCIVGGGMV